MVTCQSEIVCVVITTMLARINVLYVEAQFGKFLREPAILTVLARPRADKLAQLDIHSATRRWDVAESAVANWRLRATGGIRLTPAPQHPVAGVQLGSSFAKENRDSLHRALPDFLRADCPQKGRLKAWLPWADRVE
jgi:hypothetical protein